MEHPVASSTTSDERLMAAVSHFFGLVVALIIWATQKDRSRFVRFQAVQAMAFDIVVMVVAFITAGCLMLVMFLGMILSTGGMIFMTDPSGAPDPGALGVFMTMITSFSFLMPCAIFALVGGVWVVRLLAAIQTFQGRDFRYPWLGARVEQFLRN
ncbi:MAG: DUF4870 domain-containing protein [Anaerolineales bacterium]|nr:DUF4870 domain-containing protein [Anaerolineales bacterium]